MSAEDIPYHLRPNKYIDRQMFMDLLSRIVVPVGADKYAYISMGGRHLRDHAATYNQLGIESLLAFDRNDAIVLRQKANMPIDRMVCDTMLAADIGGRLDTIDQLFPNVSNVIVWLDYTSPADRLVQIQEMQGVAGRLQPGDVLRVTLNASNQNLDSPRDDPTLWQKQGALSPGAFRLTNLRNNLGNLVPSTLTTIGEEDLPSVLCQCVGVALAATESTNANSKFKPALLTTYKDGQRMVTITAVAVDKAGNLPREGQLQSWSFAPLGWNDPLKIEAPDLSMKEKLSIDARISETPEAISDALGYLVAESPAKAVAAIASYKQLHRFYPSFHNIER